MTLFVSGISWGSYGAVMLGKCRQYLVGVACVGWNFPLSDSHPNRLFSIVKKFELHS